MRRRATPLLIQEGWTRHQKDAGEATFDGADGVVSSARRFRLAQSGSTDHPVCGVKVDGAGFLLMPQPPLLIQEGSWKLPALDLRF